MNMQEGYTWFKALCRPSSGRGGTQETVETSVSQYQVVSLPDFEPDSFWVLPRVPPCAVSIKADTLWLPVMSLYEYCRPSRGQHVPAEHWHRLLFCSMTSEPRKPSLSSQPQLFILLLCARTFCSSERHFCLDEVRKMLKLPRSKATKAYRVVKRCETSHIV